MQRGLKVGKQCADARQSELLAAEFGRDHESNKVAADRPPTHDPRATDSPMTSVPFTQGNRELDLLDPGEQRWLAPLVVDRRSAQEKPGSPAMTIDRFRDERVSHPPWDNDQSYVTISGCDVEPEFSHHELVPSSRFEPPDH